MNLKKLFFWETEKNKFDDEVNRNEIGEIASGSDDVISNVIRLPNTSPVTDPVGLKNYQEDGAPQPLQKQLGLMDEMEIKKFFGQNHFGLGRHNGSVYKTQAALESKGYKNGFTDADITKICNTSSPSPETKDKLTPDTDVVVNNVDNNSEF